ncbi:MAG: heat-inducible transcriptional repressor HrcA [Deltaproteobacteria bacterium]|nr:heat-inducible transcriptional repressor HrcA [Deltaproteobacteria bacterium]
MVKSDIQRQRKVLQAVIQEYITTAEPVGSRRVCHKYSFDVSPATVRNIMADMEEMGFLFQPHASAGRIPTESGWRFYIDSILEVTPLSETEKALVAGSLKRKLPAGEVLKDTSRALSSFSGHTAIVSAPRFTQAVFKHVEFIRLRKGIVLVICVSPAGIVQNKIIEVEENLDQARLDRLSHYLTELLSEMTIEEAKKKILSEMQAEKDLFNRLLSSALEMSEKNLPDGEEAVYIEGKTNILRYPELCEIDKMKAIFETFEEKGILIKLLDKCITAQGVQIFIGSESKYNAIEGCSIVASPYVTGENVLGALGVIGPMRMNYARLIPLVRYTADLLGELIKEHSG